MLKWTLRADQCIEQRLNRLRFAEIVAAAIPFRRETTNLRAVRRLEVKPYASSAPRTTGLAIAGGLDLVFAQR
jgi:hypothetical protein